MNRLQLRGASTLVLNFFQVSRQTLYWSTLIAVTISLLSFPIWQQVFTVHKSLVQVQMAAPGAEYVRMYWDDPKQHPEAYERILVNPNPSQVWPIKIEALGTKNPLSRDTEVRIVGISTPENILDESALSQAKIDKEKWAIDRQLLPKLILITKDPASFTTEILGSELTIELLHNFISGRARITVNDEVSEVDLFSWVGNIEKLKFATVRPGDESIKTYQINAVDTPWRRLKFIAEGGGQIKLEEVKIRDRTISPQKDGEYILPLRLMNRFSCALVSTAIGFCLMTVLFVSTVNLWQRKANQRFGINSYIVCLAITIGGFWLLVFYPGIVTFDEINQWSQAISGNFNDWHGIGMTILLRGLITMSPFLIPRDQIPIFTFLQGSLLWLAIFYTINTMLGNPRLKLILCTIIIFYYPIWPYAGAQMKDVWLTIWFLLFVCELFKLIFTDKNNTLHLISSSLLGCMILLTRHNAIVSIVGLLLMAVAVVYLREDKKGKRSFKLTITVLAISFLASKLMLGWVNPTNAGNLINYSFAFELRPILNIVSQGENIDEFAELATYQEFGGSKFYSWLDYNIQGGDLMNNPQGIQEKELIESDTMIRDMLYVVPRYPIAYIKFKIDRIGELLWLNSHPIQDAGGYYPRSWLSNTAFGLDYDNSRLSELRAKALSWIGFALSSSNWLSFPYRHGWVLCFAVVSFLITTLRVRPVEPDLILAVLLAIAAIAYFLSFTIVTPSSLWRYLLFSNLAAMLSLCISLSVLFRNITNVRVSSEGAKTIN